MRRASVSCRLHRLRARSAGRRGRLEVVATIPVPRPAEDVWQVFSVLENWPRWDWLGSASASWTSGEPWTAGSVMRLGHWPFCFDCTVCEVRVPRTVTWVGRSFGIDARHTFRFDDHERGTLVESHEVFEGRGARLMKPLVRWYWRHFLRALRRRVALPGLTM